VVRAIGLIVIGGLLNACGGSQAAGSSSSGGAPSAGSAGDSGGSSAGNANSSSGGAGAAGAGAAGAGSSAGGASSGGASSGGADPGGAGVGVSAGSTGVSGASNGGVSGMSGAAGAAGGASGNRFISQLSLKSGGCLPRPLPVNALLAQTTCSVVEANGVNACNCSQAARAPVDANLVTVIRQQLLGSGNCGVSGQPACEKFCICEILQEMGTYGTECKTDTVAASQTLITAGFCYADDPASPALANCPANEQQKILFVSTAEEPTPSPDALAFLVCPG
jgi:hypothetical protein